MFFQSNRFVFLFLPVAIWGFYFLQKRYSKAAPVFLILASAVFCAHIDFRAVVILTGSILFNYFLAIIITRNTIKANIKLGFFTAGILVNFIVLFCFKFFSASIQDALSRPDSVVPNSIFGVGVPLGISFYTLYQISFLADVYQNKAKLHSFLSYSLSVSMFAHLPAGPVLNYKTSIKQFTEAGYKAIAHENLYKGISLFTIGLFKKTLLADPLSIFTGAMFYALNKGEAFNILESLATVWSFLLQLYFDFSAYSDMAIGIGLCFGLKFPVNFNSPLKATSFSDYISRWHISLIAFNRDYVFIPLSKYFAKKLKGPAGIRYFKAGIFATLILYIAIGFWHSPTLQFLFSGIIIGGIITITQTLKLYIEKLNIKPINHKISLGFLGAFLNRVKVLLIAATVSCMLRTNNLGIFKTLVVGFVNFKGIDFQNWVYSAGYHLNQMVGSEHYLHMLKKPISIINYSITAPFTYFIFFCSLFALYGPNTMEFFGMLKIDNNKWYSAVVWKPTLIWGLAIGGLLTVYFMIGLDGFTNQNFLYGNF